jgi:hypothetical protein
MSLESREVVALVLHQIKDVLRSANVSDVTIRAALEKQ